MNETGQKKLEKKGTEPFHDGSSSNQHFEATTVPEFMKREERGEIC